MSAASLNVVGVCLNRIGKIASCGIGGFLAGYLGTFWSGMAKTVFFLMLAIISAAAGVLITLLIRALRGILRD